MGYKFVRLNSYSQNSFQWNFYIFCAITSLWWRWWEWCSNKGDGGDCSEGDSVCDYTRLKMNPGLFCNNSVSLCLSSDILLPAILSPFLSLERNPDASAKAMLGKLGLMDNIHFIIANKILGQCSLNAWVLQC